ncbi:thiamine-phosphate kinase [Yersinia bercovieri]|uniref:thiamine-phosphate kinase n=1 Tax=Yersinia bercovieri TaxID=634 RepID=UPI0011A0BC9C|nr:thiamine-phosphate kinase [Yersinia bercovieri]MCB5303484.1 thiamine-phosphate kinase [Yersinia bercovieri]
MACGEFDLIARYFDRFRSNRRDVELGIGDDCALLTVAEKQLLAISTDTLVSGVHFLADIDPADLGYKSLAVNLSDLAAMGADPAWLSLALTLPNVNEDWLQSFSDSLFDQLNYYGMQLIGGDTTRGPLSLTLTIQGLIPEGRALTRAGARIGDWIYVTGTLGDSAAGLAILQNELRVDDEADRAALIHRHLRPQPRVLQGQALRSLASSAIDISDGLISDLQHILKASHCGARIELDHLPYSDALKNQVDAEQALRWALSGGEDYELCFTVPEINRGALDVALSNTGASYTCIGQIGPQTEGVKFFREGKVVDLDFRGFDHFSTGKSHG